MNLHDIGRTPVRVTRQMVGDWANEFVGPSRSYSDMTSTLTATQLRYAADRMRAQMWTAPQPRYVSEFVQPVWARENEPIPAPQVRHVRLGQALVTRILRVRAALMRDDLRRELEQTQFIVNREEWAALAYELHFERSDAVQRGYRDGTMTVAGMRIVMED